MKKKGFTLVELLAVIVILAVISLIATPMILGVIEKANKSAAIQSANGIMDAAEKYMIESMVLGTNASRFDFPNDTKLSYKGKKPESGTLLVDDNGNMSITIKVNGYCVRKRYLENEPVVVEDEVCEGITYKEEILNGTDPVLKDNLIPVTIKNNGVVTYADTNSEWYNYGNKVWANAVILVKEPSKTYSVGETILESDIESYFVWIPKYSYKLWDLGNYDSVTTVDTSKVHSIDIVFGTGNTSDTNENECTTPLVSGESGTCTVGDYMTHPAFITLGVNGMWVGKFETTGDTSNVTVKPNNTSLRNINVATMFDLALNYESSLNSHMMKNTEWGAVAYLSHSIYGINKEININNNIERITGYSAVEGTDQSSCPGTSGNDSNITLAYNTKTGYKASATGNISGIYDMSGGMSEYMASYVEGYLGNSGLSQSIIDTYPTYIDIYNSSSNMITYNYRILGDATGEMGPFEDYEDKDGISRHHNSWYADDSDFISSSESWFNRGGNRNIGVLAGQFYFARNTGASQGYIGFRLVLAP